MTIDISIRVGDVRLRYRGPAEVIGSGGVEGLLLAVTRAACRACDDDREEPTEPGPTGPTTGGITGRAVDAWVGTPVNGATFTADGATFGTSAADGSFTVPAIPSHTARTGCVPIPPASTDQASTARSRPDPAVTSVQSPCSVGPTSSASTRASAGPHGGHRSRHRRPARFTGRAAGRRPRRGPRSGRLGRPAVYGCRSPLPRAFRRLRDAVEQRRRWTGAAPPPHSSTSPSTESPGRSH